MKWKWSARLAGLFAVMIILMTLPTPHLYAQPVEKTIIRVAYPIQAGITDLDENGDYCGYTYEYLEEIAQYTGWTYEYVQVPGAEDGQITTLMEMVKDGEVDLMGAMLYKEQLSAQYDYSGYSYGTVETVLQTLMNSGKNLIIDAALYQAADKALYAAKDTGRDRFQIHRPEEEHKLIIADRDGTA